MDRQYDFVIIGGGPSGLTLAYTLSYLKYRVVLIERENTLGGCHRVNRQDGLFSEHGPRIYSDAYVNMTNLLCHMGLDFYDLFTEYDPDKWSFFRLKTPELWICAVEYFKLLWNPDYGKDLSVEWLIGNFSKESQDFIDRLCRMTDGAGSDRYTVHQFLQLFNQNMLHGVYIPREPNDTGLIAKWNTGDTEILLGRTVKNVVMKSNNTSEVESIILDNDIIINGSKFLFCVPPLSLIDIIRNTPIRDAFGNYGDLVEWSISTGYNPYIPIAFHWGREIDIPRKWGFPASDWGIAFIVMSRYMKFTDPESRTVISTCIMYNDRVSSVTGKTANDSTREELIGEVFRQLGTAFGKELPMYTKALPNSIYKEDSVWHDRQKAFIITPGVRFLPAQSPIINNVYTVGTHNGLSYYSFTTFESAVTNALHVLHTIAPESRKEFSIQKSISLDVYIKWILLLCICTYILYIIYTFGE